ncbi:MAG: peptidoglycan editing factor PgeF [Bacteroidia bacterium]|nr:peptidoglycan editing factor PgeF [Bacteroidia bacterium]
MIILPSVFDTSYGIVAAQSTRLGGVSLAPFFSLNLGLSVNDKEEHVKQNKELFFGKLGIASSRICTQHQVHGCEVHITNEPGHHKGFDAQITNKRNLFLAVSVADCTPILIYDTKNHAVAAIHAGWRGTVAQIVTRTLHKMQKEYGTEGKNCFAFIGACISQKHFEVGEEVAAQFDEPLKYFDAAKHRWKVDLKAANRQQLLAFGLKESHIEVSHYCTVEHNELFFSHRKENGTTGRMMAVIGMK